jgi:hypothetical protein
MSKSTMKTFKRLDWMTGAGLTVILAATAALAGPSAAHANQQIAQQQKPEVYIPPGQQKKPPQQNQQPLKPQQHEQPKPKVHEQPKPKVHEQPKPQQHEQPKPKVHEQPKPQHDQGKPQHDQGKPQNDQGKPQNDQGKPQHDQGKPQHYDWKEYQPGHRPPQWQQYHQNFDPHRYETNRNSDRRYRWQNYVQPPGWYSHRWVYGERMPPAFWGRNYWLDNYPEFGLMDPPYGYVWVRYGDDALLVDVEDGQVLSVVYGVFY